MAAVTIEPAKAPRTTGRRKAPANAPEASTVMHEQVYERLREAIISGQLQPGRTLSVRRLASEFDVSAMPAREAIRRLVALGALELTDTRRVTIANMSVKKLEEIRAARIALEPELAVRALERVKNSVNGKKRLISQLKKDDALLDKAIRQGDVTEYSKRNCDFHFTLYRASEATVLLGLVESLWLQFGPLMRIVIGRLGTACLLDDRHKEAVAALEAGDQKKLKNAIRVDIQQGMDNIKAVDFEAVS